MNWDAIGAVAELLGAIGVIVSLMYLAAQIRRNTRVQKRTNLRDIANELATTARCIATDSELASLVLRGYADLGSLDPVERFSYDNFMYAFIANFENALFDARSGDYPEEELVPMRAAIVGYLGTDGGHAWWEQRRIWFTLFGQQSIDEIISDQTIDSRGAGPVAVTQN
jgi:hypothetical protein